VQKIRLAAISCPSGAKGDNPAAIKSALIKLIQCATVGRYSKAKVVLPAPFGPAIIQQMGITTIPAFVRSRFWYFLYFVHLKEITTAKTIFFQELN
jgi:hypothetical protein